MDTLEIVMWILTIFLVLFVIAGVGSLLYWAWEDKYRPEKAFRREVNVAKHRLIREEKARNKQKEADLRRERIKVAAEQELKEGK